ncbi:MAG TPA: lecithin retinol acyltransferase family protein [Magnetospirillum sp.]|nr:lecithin retinol acyltransferase family protein [Magnetospirillum sp.]
MGIGDWLADGVIAIGDALGVTAEARENQTGLLWVAKDVADAIPVVNLAVGYIDNEVVDTVCPTEGTPIYCTLYGFEHSGIYIGNGRVVHLRGSGNIEETDLSGFIENSNAVTIYAACAGRLSIGNAGVARRASANVKSTRDYNVILDNCHQFTSGCITGNFGNADNAFWMLKATIADKLNGGESICWRACAL